MEALRLEFNIDVSIYDGEIVADSRQIKLLVPFFAKRSTPLIGLIDLYSIVDVLTHTHTRITQYKLLIKQGYV